MKLKIKSFNGELKDLSIDKIYAVDKDFGDGDIGVFDDTGFWFITRVGEPCSFLNGGEWELVNE